MDTVYMKNLVLNIGIYEYDSEFWVDLEDITEDSSLGKITLFYDWKRSRPAMKVILPKGLIL